MIIVLFSMSTNIIADGLTATLQQGDVMTPFYGVNAFQEAYNAAQDGAVITLSSGKFNDVATISKEITVIGAYAFATDNSERTLLGTTVIAANNVKFEGIYFSNKVTLGISSSKTIANCTLKRCWIESLYSYYIHENTLIDQCVVKTEQAMPKSKNYCIKNSTIGYFLALNSNTNIAYITNCVVWEFVSYTYSTSSKKYIEDPHHNRPYAIYKNNYLGIYKNENSEKIITLYSPSEYYNNLFCQNFMKPDFPDSEPNSFLHFVTISYASGCANNNNIKGNQKFEKFYEYPAHPIDAPLGSDGTVVGPYGGTGFSEYPAIPRIISKSIDSNSNAEGKINVKITVKAEQ